VFMVIYHRKYAAFVRIIAFTKITSNDVSAVRNKFSFCFYGGN
jgi:hypothetical protein